ncbi:peptidase S8/S53 domain-containing protein [Phlyctochytrium arcticum]|nr:peptidase S8/S53 domain-containing protein [Phlyctochytrium arcticum]
MACGTGSPTASSSSSSPASTNGRQPFSSKRPLDRMSGGLISRVFLVLVALLALVTRTEASPQITKWALETSAQTMSGGQSVTSSESTTSSDDSSNSITTTSAAAAAPKPALDDDRIASLPEFYSYSADARAILPSGHASMKEPSENAVLVSLQPGLSKETIKAHFTWLRESINKTGPAGGSSVHCYYETGYGGEFSESFKKTLQARPEVAVIEPDARMKLDFAWVASGTDASLLDRRQDNGFTAALGPNPQLVWGLDRIDQESLPLDGQYNIPQSAGGNVDVYILDSGINVAHPEFGGRARFGTSFSPSGSDDGNGHGSHVAGIVGGASVGVARTANLIAVKVIDDNGSGAQSNVIMGLEWIIKRAQSSGRPSVINMSIGGARSITLDMAVLRAIQSGISVVAAAGNDAHDACLDSPANLLPVITVGATSQLDQPADFTNTGSCVKVFAPGVFIKSAWKAGPDPFVVLNGTSMAAPHVTGAAAVYLSLNPQLNPRELRDLIINRSDAGQISQLDKSSPNKIVSLANLAPVRAGVGGTPSNSSPPPAVQRPSDINTKPVASTNRQPSSSATSCATSYLPFTLLPFLLSFLV